MSRATVARIIIAGLAFVAVTIGLRTFFEHESSAGVVDQSWALAVQTSTNLLLVSITGIYVYLTSRILGVQERGVEEERVRELKRWLLEGPDYANHFEQLGHWLPLRPDDQIEDRALAEFDADLANLPELQRRLEVEGPQLPPGLRRSCKDLRDKIERARRDLGRLRETAAKEQAQALAEGRAPTWQRARDHFAGQEEPWLELLECQSARDLAQLFKSLDEQLQARIDSYGPRT